LHIREERESDVDRISEITRAAFRDHPYSHQTEEFIIHALRGAKALALSLVADVDGQVRGHVAFSPVVISDSSRDWYGIGPLSVQPEYQRQGIGQALMQRGLAQLQSRGAKGCLLVGDPQYYVRFGFSNLPQLTLGGVPPENFLGLAFGENKARGKVTFHEAFTATH
jgi:putative acetyltransferase